MGENGAPVFHKTCQHKGKQCFYEMRALSGDHILNSSYGWWDGEYPDTSCREQLHPIRFPHRQRRY